MSGAKGARHPVILIIEDVKATQRVIEVSLRALSDRFHSVQSGVDGLDAARELRPDLIVLDLALPELTGDKVIRRLKADEATADIPVLVVTAHGQSGMAKSVMDLGADLFLEKPFLPNELEAAAAELLGRAEREI
ncbi:MAG: response regulator [Acidimicrobiia bacterium]|nr:response regulator [Acidimicrobiia bacterium]